MTIEIFFRSNSGSLKKDFHFVMPGEVFESFGNECGEGIFFDRIDFVEYLHWLSSFQGKTWELASRLLSHAANPEELGEWRMIKVHLGSFWNGCGKRGVTWNIST